MGSSIVCIESAKAALPTRHIKLSQAVDSPRLNLPPLYGALSMMGKGAKEAMNSPFPLFHAKLVKYTSPSWRKQYNILSAFLQDAINEARERERASRKQELGLVTDADCVLDMII
ncbi:hypothetical protein OPQ81_008194 [Rhizoctonia solani]|nr:hypothetical protein OPQ81_008194 [Rhizoctonia solani]